MLLDKKLIELSITILDKLLIKVAEAFAVTLEDKVENKAK
jgi:hypothetical protein